MAFDLLILVFSASKMAFDLFKLQFTYSFWCFPQAKWHLTYSNPGLLTHFSTSRTHANYRYVAKVTTG